MVDLDEFTTTDAALEQMANTANPRLKQIMDAAVRHMHAFVREVELTPAEWIQGLQFLTAVGQACTPIRQEFILLSDVLGVSAVVNALHDRKAKELGSQSSLLGPFFREGAPELPLGAQIVEKPTAEELVVFGQVTDTHGAPVPGALIQVWQTSERGLTTCRSAMESRWTCAAISAPTQPAIITSEQCGLWGIPFRWTGRWANWCTPREGMACDHRIFIC